ncbi:MAG: hypothetical protein A2Y07_11965 [Planctomycetes bacterium GWF2_50_10]|nr:MAG: hypothetical protein A2Y07_11965 [Planctomycetes bacterium GWF2_50_10]
MAKQLNIFIENRPGRLKSITGILSEAGLNIHAFTIQDRGDFGLIKLIVDKPKEAYLALADRGFACALKDIVAISIDDRPGNLLKLTTLLYDHQINVIDAYGFVIEPSKRGICCLEVENLKNHPNIDQLIQQEGFTILEDEKLYEI